VYGHFTAYTIVTSPSCRSLQFSKRQSLSLTHKTTQLLWPHLCAAADVIINVGFVFRVCSCLLFVLPQSSRPVRLCTPWAEGGQQQRTSAIHKTPISGPQTAIPGAQHHSASQSHSGQVNGQHLKTTKLKVQMECTADTHSCCHSCLQGNAYWQSLQR
jgi:hypothetical protein